MNIDKKKNIKQEFDRFFLISSFPNMKAGLWSTLVFLLFYAVIHHLLFPGSSIAKYFEQTVIIIPCIVFTLISIYWKLLHQWLQTILFLMCILSVVGMFIVGINSDIHQPGYVYYCSWTMLILMGTIIFFRVRYRLLVFSCCLLVIAFIAALIINKTFQEQPEVFLMNVYFLISMATLGYFTISYRYYTTLKLFQRDRELTISNESLSQEIRERNKAHAEVQEAGKKYHELIDSIPDWINVIDRNFTIVLFNKAYRDICLELNIREDVLGRNLFDVFPFFGQDLKDELQFVFKEGKELVSEETTVVNGKTFHTETRKIPLFGENEVLEVMTIVRNISEKVEIEELKKKNFDQKELLLKEIHHRVKNNLAIVISLIDMQLRNSVNPEFLSLSTEIKLRIKTMGLIHENLYKSDELDRIHFSNYLMSVIANCSSTFGGDHIKLNTQFDHTDIRIETAMPIGLISNEFLAIVCKNAFPDHRKGEINIEGKVIDPCTGLYRLAIKVNSNDLPDRVLENPDSELGMLIIRLLVQQIEADLNISYQQGISFIVKFNSIPSIN